MSQNGGQMGMEVRGSEAPAFVRPTLVEINARPLNGLRAVSTFSGGGGSSLGLRMAGWKVEVANEFVSAAADTYRANFPDTKLLSIDIRDVTVGQILALLRLSEGELDLFEGSPPCASFSQAGNREAGWGETTRYSDVEQRTDDLFWEWMRLLRGLRPRAFIAENVPGMLSGAALKEYAHVIDRMLRDMGYRVITKVLNAANYGVPQERRRLIFLGIREDLRVQPTWPSPTTPWPHTLRQALMTVEPGSLDHDEWLEESSMVGKAVGRTWEWKKGLRDKYVCVRCERPLREHRTDSEYVWTRRKQKLENSANRERQVLLCEDDERAVEVKEYFMHIVPELDEPCPTLTAKGANRSAASLTHPTECRKLTPAECKAVMGFPPDFVLTGIRSKRYERMGRAVPPPLYEVLGAHVATLLGAGS